MTLIEQLPKELLVLIQYYSQNADWKHLMNTSKESFEELKYKTIQVDVSFNKLTDRVLPPFVSRLLDPSRQLNLHLNLGGLYEYRNDGCYLNKMKGWRSHDRLSMKDIKWFLSIPARSLTWPFGGFFLDENRKFIRALRNYEKVFLSFDENYSPDEDFNFSDLDYCQRIQSFTIKQLEDCNVPILPSLTELHLVNDDRVDLSNLVYSPLLKKVTVIGCFSISIPKGLKDRGVTFNIDEDEGLEEVDVLMEEDEEEKQFSDNYYLYDEDEVTVYDDEDAIEESGSDAHEDEGKRFVLSMMLFVTKGPFVFQMRRAVKAMRKMLMMRKKEKRMIKLMLDIALCCSCSIILSIGV